MMMGFAFLDRVTLYRIGAGFGFAVLIALFLGWGSGYTPPPPLTRAAPEQWKLNPPAPPDAAKDLATLKARHPWSADLPGAAAGGAGGTGGAGGPGAPADPQAVWRLAGVIERGDERFALIAIGVEPSVTLEYKKIGDALPDGTVLVQITPNSATTGPSEEAPKDAPKDAANSIDAPDTNGQHIYRLFGSKK
jgi:hypothetical protein